MASMPHETIAKSLEYCVEALVNNTEDVKEVMGTTHYFYVRKKFRCVRM